MCYFFPEHAKATQLKTRRDRRQFWIVIGLVFGGLPAMFYDFARPWQIRLFVGLMLLAFWRIAVNDPYLG
jgi:hypothetical protein